MGRPQDSSEDPADLDSAATKDSKNSPMIFGEALAGKEISFPLDTTKCQIPQYVEDLLLMAETCSQCWEGTKTLLGLLDQLGKRPKPARLR